VIGQLKVFNSLLKPYEELTSAAGEIKTMAELAEDDSSFESEIEPALVKAEKQYEAFELQAMMSGKHDSASAVVSIKPGAAARTHATGPKSFIAPISAGRTDTDSLIEDVDEEPNLEAGLQSVSFKIVGPYAYGYMQSEIGGSPTRPNEPVRLGRHTANLVRRG